MADEKVPLQASTNSGPVDYNAYFAREGDSRDRSQPFATSTVIGKCRNPRRFNWFEWIFVFVAAFSILGVLALTIYRFDYFEKLVVNITNINKTNGVEELARCPGWTCTSDFIFAVALLVNLAFCAFYCYDGVLRERPFEVLAYVIGVLVIIIYTIGNFAFQLDREVAIKDDNSTMTSDFKLKIARFVLVLVFGPLNILLAMLSWWKMGFLALNTIGVNKKLIFAYRCRSFFLTLQWFSLQVLLNIFVLAWSRDGQLISIAEKVILPVLVVISLLVIITGNVAVLWEYHIASVIWYILMVPHTVYYFYKMIEVSIHWKNFTSEYFVYNNKEDGGTEILKSTFVFVGACLLIASIIGIIVSALLVVFMALAQKYFRLGLKDKIPPPFTSAKNTSAKK